MKKPGLPWKKLDKTPRNFYLFSLSLFSFSFSFFGLALGGCLGAEKNGGKGIRIIQVEREKRF